MKIFGSNQVRKQFKCKSGNLNGDESATFKGNIQTLSIRILKKSKKEDTPKTTLTSLRHKCRPEDFTETIVSGYVSVTCWQNDGTEKWFPMAI